MRRLVLATRITQISAVALALGGAYIVLSVPMYTVVSGSVTYERTLAQERGLSGTLVVALIPVAIALLPLPFRGRAGRVVACAACGLMVLGCMLALLSLAFFYLPALAAMVSAAILATAGPRTPPG